jgi:hypothetical protein
MNDIIYPTLDLFLFDLRNSLGEDDLEQNTAHFQKKLPASVSSLLLQKSTYFEAEYEELLPKKFENFKSNTKTYSFQGYYYPVRLGDTYGLLLDCSVDNQTDPQEAKCFADLKTQIEQQLQGETAAIGQSWMISGWLPNPDSQNPEAVAKACYQALIPTGNWEHDLEGEGKFLGANIYELWRYRLLMQEETTSITSIQNIQDNQHVIVIIYPNKETAEKASRFYSDWLRLLSYRNKILWSYGQSRFLKESIKNYFVAIEEARKSINVYSSRSRKFEHFRQTMEQVQDILNSYTIDLNKLDFQGRTIDINLSNYKKRRAKLEKKSEGDLSFLEEFSDLVTDKYLLQITKDSENLERGLRLLEDVMKAVRNRVEVDKAERDRYFQDTVTVIGVGWSVGSFVASLEKLGEDKQDPMRLLITNSPIPQPWQEPAIPLAYTLSVAIVAAFLTWLVRQLWSRIT